MCSGLKYCSIEVVEVATATAVVVVVVVVAAAASCGDDLISKIHGWITHGPSPEWQLTDLRRSDS